MKMVAWIGGAVAVLALAAEFAVINARLGALESRRDVVRDRVVSAVDVDPLVPPPHTTAREVTAAPAPAAPVAASEVRKAVVEALRDLELEQSAKWNERMKKAGMDVLGHELALNSGQTELLAPVVEEHLKAIQSVWWPGTVKDESGGERMLTYEEKLKLSEEERARVDERMRVFLSTVQYDAYRAWVAKWREEAPKRTGDAGPLRWY